MLLALSLLALLACSPDGGKDTAAPGGGSTPGDTGGTGDSAAPGDTGSPGGDTGAAVTPPLDGSSGGSGGSDYPTGTELQLGGVQTWLLAPSGSASGHGVPLLLVISGTEGGSTMLNNMRQVAPYYGLEDALVAVLDGRSASAQDGAAVLDALRSLYDVDNDRTWLLSESAGTRAGLELGLELRQSYFAAYWANDVNARGTPALSASELGFAPWGNAGPGGDYADAEAIVEGMRSAGYRLPADAPYSGAGADTHGSTEQFLAAVDFFADKER